LKFTDLLSESGFKMPCTQRNIHGKDLVKGLETLCTGHIFTGKNLARMSSEKIVLSWEFLGGENEHVFLFLIADIFLLKLSHLLKNFSKLSIIQVRVLPVIGR